MSWVARGNQAADEHWRPAGDVCAMCSMNLSFIAHSEHYGEDAQVLSISKSVKICLRRFWQSF